MHERTSYLHCEAVTASVPEIMRDIDLGELQVFVITAEPAPKPKRAPLVLDDPDLGPLICSPDVPGNPRRTAGPPCSRSAGER